MFIKTFPVGVFQCNCILIADEKTGEAFVVDPGDEAEKITAILNQHSFRVKYIVHTHGHIDHIGATRPVHEACGGDICLHRDDLPLYNNLEGQAQALGLQLTGKTPSVTIFLEDRDVLELSKDIQMEVLATPGHTPGSVCFLIKKSPLILSGDTLFFKSIGRTDLWGGNFDQIIDSIRRKLFTLPEDTVVLPGHGPKTTIACEKRHNPFFQGN